MLIVVLSVMGGIIALNSMIKESTPDLDVPIATVETIWAGADPDTIDREVTEVLEKEIKSLPGIAKLRSASFNSFSIVTVEFEATSDSAESMSKLRAKVSDAETELPDEAETPEVTQKSVNDTPINSLALYGDIDPGLLGRTALRLEKRLERVDGVGEVDLSGHREEIIRIRLLHARLAALGLSPAVVRDRIQAANRDQPWDRFEGETIGATMRLYGRFRDVEDLRRLPVMRLNSGRVVRLQEVAEVRRDLEREESTVDLSWRGAEFQPTVDIGVKKAPGTDSLEVIAGVKLVMEREVASANWPVGLQYAVTADQSESINADLSSVANTAWQAMLGVALILFVILSWREAIIAGLAIPITFMASLAIVWALGNTLNQVVIVGLVLALGLLVDVFILMMEGMHDNIFAQRKSFNDSAMSTINVYAAPAFAGQMTTILAMIPLLVIGGLAGKFISIIPETAITTLVVSYVVALLVAVPLSRFALASLAGTSVKPTLMDGLTERSGAALQAILTRGPLRNRTVASMTVVGAFALLGVSILAAGSLKSEMFPKDDGRNLGVTIEMPPDTPLSTSRICSAKMGEALRLVPYFQSVTRFTGAKSPMAMPSISEALTPAKDTYLVSFSAYFVPLADRERYAYTYVDDLREKLTPLLDNCPGGVLTFTPQTGGTSAEDPVQVVIYGDDVERLREVSAQVQTQLRGIEGALDVRDTMGVVRTDVRSTPRREVLDFHGLSLADVAYQIRVAMTDDEIGTFPLGAGQEDIGIRLGTAWPSRAGELGGPSSVGEASSLSVIKPDGTSLPLFSVVQLNIDAAPLVLSRDNGERAVTVKAQTQGVTAGEVLAQLTPWLEEAAAAWPADMSYRIAGEAEDQAQTFGDAVVMMGVALFLVFALLVIQFDSFTQPIIILSAVPLALIGVLAALIIGNVPVSFPALIGVIALIGIVVNNAIVMVDTINGHLAAGVEPDEAAARGSSDRLRPIIATTITTIVGLVPLALSDSFWMPLCLAVIAGLIASTVISLVVVPALYLVLTKRRELPVPVAS